MAFLFCVPNTVWVKITWGAGCNFTVFLEVFYNVKILSRSVAELGIVSTCFPVVILVITVT